MPEIHKMIFQWHITDRCTLQCRHCYQEPDPGRDPTITELAKILSQFEDLLQHQQHLSGRKWRGQITITGGDPLIHPNFLTLLERIAARRSLFSFAVLTNGTMIDDAAADNLKRLKPAFVQLSLEGGQQTHDQLRGPGNYRQTALAMGRLVRRRIPVFVSFTAHRGNCREFPAVAELGRRMGASRVWADRMIPWGRGAGMADRVLSPAETREFFEIMHAVQQKRTLRRATFNRLPTKIAMHRALQFLVAAGAPYHCSAGDKLLTVMPDGTLFPCRRLPIAIGNLHHTHLIDLYVNSPFLKDLRDPTVVSFGCEGCRHAHRCRGGLKCLAYAVANDPFTADPGCWLAVRKSAPGSFARHTESACLSAIRAEMLHDS